MTISAVRVRLIREALRLSAREFGTYVVEGAGENVDRTVRAWEAGKDHPGSQSVRKILALEAEAQDLVDDWVTDLNQSDSEDRAIITFRNDEQMNKALPDVERPAAWHRALVNRVLDQVEGVGVMYYDDPESGPHDYWPSSDPFDDDFAYINSLTS